MLVTRSELLHRIRSALATSVAAAIVVGAAAPALSQNRVDLDDMNIKGELLNDNRMRLSARDAHQISDRVSYRNNFRKEISDGLEIPWPDAQTGANAETNRAPAATDTTKGAQ